MKNSTLLIAFFLGCLTTYSQEDSLKKEHRSIDYVQFNTIDNPANVGIQNKNLYLSTFSDLPNNSFNEVHNRIGIDGYLNEKETFGIGLYYSVDNWSNYLIDKTLGVAFK